MAQLHELLGGRRSAASHGQQGRNTLFAMREPSRPPVRAAKHRRAGRANPVLRELSRAQVEGFEGQGLTSQNLAYIIQSGVLFAVLVQIRSDTQIFSQLAGLQNAQQTALSSHCPDDAKPSCSPEAKLPGRLAAARPAVLQLTHRLYLFISSELQRRHFLPFLFRNGSLLREARCFSTACE